HIRRLLNWRKSSAAISHGTLKHFIPLDNLYVYNRKSENESVLVLINNSDKEVTPDISRYTEVLEGFEGAHDVLSGRSFNHFDDITIQGNTSLVLELKPVRKADN